jgi:putative hydrolase of the HAD superfamily
LKRSATGAAACLFDKDANGYRVVNVSNETLVQLLVKEYDSWFGRGGNPLLRHVIFDAAGVAFDGDVADFYERVRESTGIDVHPRAQDYSLVDSDLNLGTCDIVEVVKRRNGAAVTDEQADCIRRAWSTTWTLNPNMAALAQRLRQIGLTVSICSNCDSENADVYEVNGYFDAFDRVFLSCEMQLLKPDKEFFEHMLSELGAKPWQILFIDDARRATDEARQLGFEVLSMPRIIAAEAKSVFVAEHLTRLRVL